MKMRFTLAALAAAAALVALPATSQATFKKDRGHAKVAAAAYTAPAAAPRKDWLADHWAKKQAMWAQKRAAWDQMWAAKRAAWDQLWAAKRAMWEHKKSGFRTAAAAPAPAAAPAKAPRRPLK